MGSVGASGVFGIGLALLGCLALVMGTVRFLHSRRGIDTDNFDSSAAPYLVVVAGSLALAGVFIVYVLLSG